MRSLQGWLLDVYIEGSKAVLWIKSEDGKVIRLTDHYKPNFYIAPEEPSQIEEILTILSTHPNITLVEHEKRYTSLNLKKSDVLHIYVDSVQNYKKVLSDLKKVKGIKAYYNLDLLHVQWYLFQRDLPPTSKVQVTYNKNNELVSFEIIDDGLEIPPPPFKSLIFDLEVSSERLSPNVNSDPISRIEILDDNLNLVKAFEGEEKEILEEFEKYIKKEDPDFLIAHEVEEALTYILERALILGLNLQLGREKEDIFKLKKLLPYSHRGRVHIDLHTFLSIGIAGVVERSRFTLAPPGLAAKWPAGRTIDSRQCFEALKKGILIPKSHSFFRYVRTAKETIFSDRGGLILSPKVGLHENVGVLDFESMFPYIIIKYNVSYETATPNFIRTDRRGFLSYLTKKYLERRLNFKHLRKKFPKDSKEWLWCQQRQTALKGILVCIYGYSGCFANRYNNVVCYEQINRLARETLVKAMNVALAEGFEVIYADSDSLFVKKKDAGRENFEALARRISDETGLPIALEQHFKFLVLLRQEGDPNLEATRRYFGKLTNGELYYRGIELRRHDFPVFLKELETRLMEILFDAESAEEVWKFQYKKAFDFVIKACDLIRSGKVPLDDLVISKILRKPVNSYRSLFPHVIAAIQLVQKGKRLKSGEKIDYVYVNAEHKNPFRRVVPAAILDKNYRYYDRDKYVELVLDIAETILGIFGFSRKNLGLERSRRTLSKN
jgi:DNA polymerase elongation subunit (family B)